MREYLRNSLWDFLLCFIASAALAYTVCSSFFATLEVMERPYVIILVSLLACATLFVIAYQLRTLVIGGIAAAVVLVAVLVVAMRMGSSPSILQDEVGNYALAVLLMVLPPLLVFALSRRKPTLLVLIVAGVVLCGVVEYLYWKGHVLAFASFAVASGALYVYRNYQTSLFTSQSDDLSLSAAALAGVSAALVACLAGAGLFFAAVQPLDPPNLVIKLITEHVRIEDEHVLGTGSEESVVNDDLRSDNENDQTANTDMQQDEEQARENKADANPDPNNAIPDAGSALSLDERSDAEAGMPTSFEVADFMPLIIAGSIVMLVVAAILVKKLLRARTFKRLRSLSEDEQVVEFFLFFLARLTSFGIPAPNSLTLREYVLARSDQLQEFERGYDGEGFAKLAEAYNRTVFGRLPASASDVDLFVSYYKAFYRNARRYLGTMRYCLAFFFI